MSNVINLPPNRKSGLYKAPSHAEGGVQVIVDGTRKVEVEGDEIHLCKTVLQDNKKYEFKNKTNKQILDAIFQDNSCEFRQGFADSGDYIICKLVVRDDKKRDLSGTAKEIIDTLQSEKSCKVTDAAADTYNNRLGGKFADNDNEIDTLIDLTEDSLKENPNNQELADYLELLKETKVSQSTDSITKSEAFKKWFKGSKVVDKNGNPEIYYHGTFSPIFHVFDIEKVADDSLYGKGFYFTNDKDVATEYSSKCDSFKQDKTEQKKWTDNVKKIIIPENKRSDFLKKYSEHAVGLVRNEYKKEYEDFFDSIKNEFLKTGKLILFFKKDLESTYSDGLLSCRDFDKLIGSKLYREFGFDFLDSHVKEVYLSIKNPIDIEQKVSDSDINDLLKFSQKYAYEQKMADTMEDAKYLFFWKKILDEFYLPDDKKFKWDFTVKSIDDYSSGNEYQPMSLKLIKDMWKQILNFKAKYPEPFEYKNKEGETHTYANIKMPPIRKDKKMTWANLLWILSDGNSGFSSRRRNALLAYFKHKKYDGLFHVGGWNVGSKSHNVYVALEPNQIKYADGSNTTFDANNPDMRYVKGGDVVYDNDTLIGVHNLWIEYLVFADEMGGLPMPSLAIINPNIPFVKYGEITLVAPKDMYDPKESLKNRVFNRDVYSPRFPTVYLKSDKKKLAENFSKYVLIYGEDTEFLKKFDKQEAELIYDGFRYVYEKLENGKGSTVRKIISDVEYNTNFLLAFARAKNIQIPLIKYKYSSLTRILNSEPNEKSIDKLKKFIDEKYPELKNIGEHYQHDDKKIIKSITNFYKDINTDITMLRNRYSNGRKNKDLDEMIIDMGKEHISKNINDKGEIFYSTGIEVVGEIRKLYKDTKIINESELRDFFEKDKFYNENINEIQEFIYELSKGAIIGHYFIQSPSGRKVPMTLENVERYMKSQGLKSAENFFYGLSNSAAIAAKSYRSLVEAKKDFDSIVSTEEFQKRLDDDEELIEKAQEVRKYYKYQDSSNSFYTALGKVGQHENPSDETIQRIFRSEDFNDIPSEYMDDIRKAASSIRNMPTEYFEVKLKKSVRLNEFVGAIIPEHFTEGIEILKNNGIKVIETYSYDKDNKKRIKNRMAALKKLIEETDIENSVTFKDGGEVVEEQKTIGLLNTDFSTIYFADKKGGFSYPEVKLVNEHDILEYSEPLPHSVVVVFNEKESLTPDYIQLNEIKFVVVPEPMVNDIKPILNKHGVKFVTYKTNESNLKEAKLNAVKSLLK